MWMRGGMKVCTWVLVCGVAAGSGCALFGGAKPGKTEASELKAPSCPDSIAAAAPMEDDYGPHLHARSWVPGLSLTDLGFVPGPEATETFRVELPLAGQRVVALGVGNGKGAGLVLLRPEAGGYCVVNHWSTYMADHVDYSLAGSWTARDKKMSILLLKLVVRPGMPTEQPRWILVGTDGQRAWYALGHPPQHHLLVPQVKLVPAGKRLFLDVMMRWKSRFRLGRDGRFITGQ